MNPPLPQFSSRSLYSSKEIMVYYFNFGISIQFPNIYLIIITYICLVETCEPVNQVGTQKWVNVVYCEESSSPTITGPSLKSFTQ